MSASGGFRGWFADYLAAFNRADFDAFSAHYADDVIFDGQAAQVIGRDAIVEFYRKVRSYLDETVEILTFVGAPDERRIIAELQTTLVALRDWPDMPTGPMKQGDVRQSVNIVVYDIADGRFTRIRTANVSRSVGGQT